MRSDPYCIQFCQATSPLGAGIMALMRFASDKPSEFKTSGEAVHLIAHFYPNRLKAMDTFYNVISQGTILLPVVKTLIFKVKKKSAFMAFNYFVIVLAQFH